MLAVWPSLSQRSEKNFFVSFSLSGYLLYPSLTSVFSMFLSQTLRVTFVTLNGPIEDAMSIAQKMMMSYLDRMILGIQLSITNMHKKIQDTNAQYRFDVMPYSDILWTIAIVAVAMGKMQV